MRKIEKCVIGVVCMFLLLTSMGCQTTKEEGKDATTPANLKEIVGQISEVQQAEDGDIIIWKQEITETVHYYNYVYEGVTIGLLAVRDSNGNVRVVINTCQSCGGSPYAYFVQVGDLLQCQNCGSLFAIDSLGELIDYGCNPIGIENMEETEDYIKISHTELEQYKSLFENWQGPTNA